MYLVMGVQVVQVVVAIQTVFHDIEKMGSIVLCMLAGVYA